MCTPPSRVKRICPRPFFFTVLLSAAQEFMYEVGTKNVEGSRGSCLRTHQYNSSFGCGKLHQDPLVTVWTPQAKPVAFRQPDCQQTGSNSLHLQTGSKGELGLDSILAHRCRFRWRNIQIGTNWDEQSDVILLTKYLRLFTRVDVKMIDFHHKSSSRYPTFQPKTLWLLTCG